MTQADTVPPEGAALEIDLRDPAVIHVGIVDEHEMFALGLRTCLAGSPLVKVSPVVDEDVDVVIVSPRAAEEQFCTVWREDLLRRAWDALAEFERQSGQPLFTVLHFRTDHLDLSLAEMARQFDARFGRPVNEPWISKRLYLAREKLKDLLVEEVAQSLDNPTTEQLEQELVELGLFDYCRPALER